MHQNHRILSLVSSQHNNHSSKHFQITTLPSQLVSDIEQCYNVSIDHQSYNTGNHANTTNEKNDSNSGKSESTKNSHIVITATQYNENINNSESIEESLNQAEKGIKFIIEV